MFELDISYSDVVPDLPNSKSDIAKVSLILCQAADFYRRVEEHCATSWLQVFWLSHKVHGEVCEFRRRAAQLLVSFAQRRVDINVIKLVAVFAHDFEFAAAHGIVPVPLFNYAKMLNEMVWPDTQEVESANKLVSGAHQIAPGIGPQLKRARVCIKKSMMAFVRNKMESRTDKEPNQKQVADAILPLT